MEMIDQMAGHRLLIQGNDNSSRDFGSGENIRIKASQREIVGIAYPIDIQGQKAHSVVTLYGTPKGSAQIFIQQKRQGHPLVRQSFAEDSAS